MNQETHVITLRLPAELARQVRKRALDDGRSFASWVRKCLAESSEGQKRENVADDADESGGATGVLTAKLLK